MSTCRLHPRGPSPDPALVDRCRALPTSTLSDSMERTGGVCGVHPVPGGRWPRVAGPALTVRTRPGDNLVVHRALDLAEPGDVLVIEGVMGCSNMGGQSATIAQRQGFAGAVVDGTVRDPQQYREMGWPVWCRGFTPITGKWRMQTVEVNGIVQVCGVQVNPGDLVCADEAGVCFLPRGQAAAVLDVARKIDAADTRRKADIEQGVTVAELMQRKYK